MKNQNTTCFLNCETGEIMHFSARVFALVMSILTPKVFPGKNENIGWKMLTEEEFSRVDNSALGEFRRSRTSCFFHDRSNRVELSIRRWW